MVHIWFLQTSSEPLIIEACVLQTSQQPKHGQTTLANLDIVFCVHKYVQEMRPSFSVLVPEPENVVFCMYATFSTRQGTDGATSGLRGADFFYFNHTLFGVS